MRKRMILKVVRAVAGIAALVFLFVPLAAHKRDRRLRRFSRPWKAAIGCKFRCAIIFPRFFPGLPISRSGAFQTLLPLCGSPGSHRLKRPGISVKEFCHPVAIPSGHPTLFVSQATRVALSAQS